MSEPKKTGYELSFADFQRLLSDTDYSPPIVPLLRRWFGYEIDADGKSIRILSANEVEIDMFSLYQQIQAILRLAIYEIAKSAPSLKLQAQNFVILFEIKKSN